jgi:7-carboxy-7-deazaguanine synthase
MHASWARRLQPLAGLPPDQLQIHEIFTTIQGEGTRAGLACTLVRTTGCNLRCTWCDTRDAFAGGKRATVAEVLETVGGHGLDLVEVTGGEPLVQPAVLPLLAALCDAGHTVLLETSGSLPVAGVDRRVVKILDLKAPASGEVNANLWDNLEHLQPHDEVKVILADRSDYEWARATVIERDLGARATVLFGAAWGSLESRTLAEWILADRLPVRLQLQLHKLLGLP